jgi:hypothetical protein
VGFGATGFHIDTVKEKSINAPWYQSIHINGNEIWYGVELGNHIHLFNIGCSE